jgi:hypothetical protein
MKKFTMGFRLGIMFDVMDTRKEGYISLEEINKSLMFEDD